MFSDYKKRVVSCYQEKKKQGNLAPNMTFPTPAKLREECLMVYAESTKSKDESTLRTFFGTKGDRPDYSRAIQQVNTDKFKPLIRFLDGKTADTEGKNIELLAWLIDYEPRPYQFTYGSKSAQTELPEAMGQPEEFEPGDVIGQAERTNSENKDFKIPVKPGIASPKGGAIYKYFLALTVACTGGAFFYNVNQPHCMYWEGSRYEPINCEEKIPGVMAFPFDPHKIKHFKRITRPDTLDYHHIGSTWYTKAGMDSVEFFTDAGTHPTNHKALRPVTKYIIRKYVKGDD